MALATQGRDNTCRLILKRLGHRLGAEELARNAHDQRTIHTEVAA